ncbi:hypothetical protein ACT3TD_13725 [Corynebacterium sp. AOP36-E1-14]|uniref:hypothetical protein n=1 Tax=Corynebacterium sp. AOP36-E1-14 TaxID=3457682 RepID=UPI004033AD24
MSTITARITINGEHYSEYTISEPGLTSDAMKNAADDAHRTIRDVLDTTVEHTLAQETAQ